jgi:transcriptional regulator with XRE-family HTH domain
MVSPLGQRIKAYRELAGLSQNRLAQRSGVPRPTITCVEGGTQNGLSAENLHRIAQALGLTLEQLTGESVRWRPYGETTIATIK